MLALRRVRAPGFVAPCLGLRKCSAGSTTVPQVPQKPTQTSRWELPEWWQVSICLGTLGVGLGGVSFSWREYRLQLEQSRLQLEQSRAYIVRQGAAKILEPFAPAQPEMMHLVQRAELEVVSKRLKEKKDGRTTIIAGQFQTGKSVIINMALEGAKGVIYFIVDKEGWQERLCKRYVNTEDQGLFEEALREAAKELGTAPLIYLDVPRHSSANIAEISTYCKGMVTDMRAARVVVVASQLTTALGFDAGGKERQEDIWVGPMNEDEARDFLSVNFPMCQKYEMDRIVKEVGTNPGAMLGIMQDMTYKGMSIDRALEVRYEECDREVRALLAIQLPGRDGKLQDVGKEIAAALLKSGDTEAIKHGPWEKKGFPAKVVAAKIKEVDAYGISYHTEKHHWHFSSPMHKKAARTKV